MLKTDFSSADLITSGIENVSNYCIFMIDQTGKILSWNKGAENITKYGANEITGAYLSKLYMEEEAQKLCPQRHIQDAIKTGNNETFGWRLRKDGIFFWCSENITLIKSTRNHPLRLLVILRDLTRRRQTEHHAREWLRVFEDSGWAISRIKHDNSAFELANKAFAEMHGYSLKELKGRYFTDIVAPAFREQFQERLKQINVKGHDIFESTHLRKNGTSFPVIVEGNPIKDADGKIQYVLVNVRNISEFKEIQHRIERSEEKYKQLFEQASDGIFIANLNGIYTDVNPAGCQMLGYTKQQLVGRSISDLLAEKETGKLALSKKFLSTPGHVEVEEWNLKKADGSYLPVEVSAKILPDGRWQAFVRDISERKRLQEISAKSEKKFRMLMDEAHDGIVVSDNHGLIEFMNKNIKSWFGYTEQELLGQPIEMLVPERFRAMHIGHRFQYMADPSPRPMGMGLDLFAVRKNGTEFPVDISLSPLTTEKGISVAAFIRDLSDRKRSDAQQKFLAESSKVLIQELDIDTSLQKMVNLITPFMADFCIIFDFNKKNLRVKATSHSNPARQQDLLMAAHGLFTNPATCPYSPDSSPDNQKPVLLPTVTEHFLKTLAQHEDHFKLLKSLNPRSIMMFPLVVKNKIIGILFFVMSDSGRSYTDSDLGFTELIALRIQIALERIMLYNEAKKATQARQDILAIVSHDLKNPLTVIKSGFNLIPKLIESNKITKAHEFLEAAQRSTLVMERLINDLLDFSKIQEGTLRIKARPARVKDMMNAAVEAYADKARAKSIDFTCDKIPEDLIIACDAVRVEQVLGNIISNAIKFTPERGKVHVSLLQSESTVQFAVSDTGTGIPEEQQPYIFDRYWQVKQTAHLGSGLGLSIVKGLVDAHHGKIWIKSRVGEGSTFYIEFPKHFNDQPDEDE